MAKNLSAKYYQYCKDYNKEKNRQYGHESYKNLSEDEK